MTRCFCLAIVTLWCLGGVCAAGSLHPQDGPHADLRVAIEDRLVRFSVGVNLAFLDEVIDEPREALGELSPEESDRVLRAFEELLLEGAPCLINGVAGEPVFERLEMFRHPEPGMVAVFPKMGTRALIRATAIVRFDAPETVETVEVTWPAYPFDRLAERMEQTGDARPRMYFEVVMTEGGKSHPARFTHAEPTIRWTRAESAGADPLEALPLPITGGPRGGVPVMLVGIGVVALGAIGFGAMRRTPRAWIGALSVGAVLGGIGFALRDRVPMRLGAEPVALISEEDAERVFLAIHESMYRAFDYTAESDIYDRLAMALDGELLGELYEQIRLSLLQAEEEMKVGVVTGLEPIETEIAAVDLSARTSAGLGFDATHRWRVDGTVYHWGHSHTRAHVYQARYRVTHTEHGWRITEHQLLSQERIEPDDGEPFETPDPVQQMLDRLGQPDL